MLADASENMAGADNPWAVDEVGAENLRGCASAWENPPASKSTSEEAAPPSKRLRGDNGMPVVERGQILRGGEYVQNINGPKGLSHDNTFCLGATAMDTMFIPAEDGSVQGDMRGRLGPGQPRAEAGVAQRGRGAREGHRRGKAQQPR